MRRFLPSVPDVGELIQRYGRLIRSVVARVSGQNDDAMGDEIEQRVAEAIFGQVRREQTILHPASYIYRCAVRETIRELSREAASAPLEEELAGEGAPNPEEQARGRQLAVATEAALGQLQPERAAAARAHLAGFSVEEIMSTHEWPYQKARNLVARGMADLRRLLVARGFSDG